MVEKHFPLVVRHIIVRLIPHSLGNPVNQDPFFSGDSKLYRMTVTAN